MPPTLHVEDARLIICIERNGRHHHRLTFDQLAALVERLAARNPGASDYMLEVAFFRHLDATVDDRDSLDDLASPA